MIYIGRDSVSFESHYAHSAALCSQWLLEANFEESFAAIIRNVDFHTPLFNAKFPTANRSSLQNLS